ncbi:hypothetical protein pqer_cds_1010 [Pandoravirus quercus]|uniref:Uncharacterized protein n=1 Tax=Pandoravirus quercus TaxID=2107709 RepID=A0A2U7UAK8_9VIRU|nr:hypothetical protein pqer_cds_1010 [Pandoravirus quercus]AVK75432.1 hypothetical protein pqer_cds_1010 [Pandoravirus quercus]
MEATDVHGAGKEHVSGETKPTAATATIASAQKEAVLAEAALDCVAWNETVDVGRLLLLEHEHDVGLLRHIVARAGARLDEYEEHRSFDFINDARVMDLKAFFDARSRCRESIWVRRHDGALWSVHNGARRMTDAQATSWLAVCARHCLFALEYDVPPRVEEVDSDHLDRDDTHKEEDHETTWLASVARGLAGRSGAWTGVEVMRTRNLCLALLAILDARAKGGPLAVVDLPDGNKVGQGAVPSPADRREGDGALLASMSVALAQVEHLRQAGFAFYVARAGRGLCGPAGHTRQVLSLVCAAVDRLYATESFYLGVIAPAEYEAIATNGPLGATLFH